MDTRSKGAVPKRTDSAKKRARRNLADQITPNFGGRSPPNQSVPMRQNSTTTLSSQSIPATPILAGFAPNNAIQVRAEIHNDDVIEVGMPEQELDALMETGGGDNANSNAESLSNQSNRDTNSETNVATDETMPSLVANTDTANHSNQQPMASNELVNRDLENRIDQRATTTIEPTNAAGPSSQPPVPSNLHGKSNHNRSNHSAIPNESKIPNGANTKSQHRMPNNPQFELRHGQNYQGNFNQTNVQAPSAANASSQPPPMESQVGTTNRTVFASNKQMQMPSQPFYTPPLGMIQVDAQIGAENAKSHRTVTDIRMVYLERLRETYNRLMSESFHEPELKTMLDRAIDYAARITKFVEAREDSNHLPENEKRANQAMWAESTALVDHIKTDVNTKLTYLQAGTQPNAHEQRRIAHIRRLQAKIEPFGGNLEQWTNFKAKWLEYYHNCNDMSEFELFMKLDEFITPTSEAYELIKSYDRSINGSYQDAWDELCARYDNPRLQVENILNKLTCIEPIGDCRDDYLRAYTTINNFVHSLPRMNIDVTSWNPIIIHLLERKMHDKSFKKWCDARTPREIPQLQQYIDFLITEIDRGDSSSNANRDSSRDRHRHQQNNRGTSSQSGHRNHQAPNANRQPQAKQTHPANHQRPQSNENSGTVGGAPQRPKSAIQKVLKCAICNMEQHKSYQCPTFLKLDLNGRMKKLRDHRLCENCLRPNCHPNRCTLRNCTNTGCEQKHNRLVCPLTFSPSVNNVQSADANQA